VHEPVVDAADVRNNVTQFAAINLESLNAAENEASPIPATDQPQPVYGDSAFELQMPSYTEPASETGFEVAEIIAEQPGFAIVESSLAGRTPIETPDEPEPANVTPLGLSAVKADRLAAALWSVEPSASEPEEVAAPPVVVPSPVSVAPPPVIVPEPVIRAEAPPVVSELPPAVIDEIVHKVVAKLSDTIVREIAWEVVPEVVERVVERLARESTLKKTGT
jgi:hypothetical protein